MLEALGARLRQERVRKGLNQVDFAALGEASRNSQGQYEAGKTPPTTEYLLKLQEHGVDIGFIVTGRRSDGSAGFVEQHLLNLFRAIEPNQQEALLNLLDAMAGRPRWDLEARVGEDPVHSVLQSPRVEFRTPQKPDES